MVERGIQPIELAERLALLLALTLFLGLTFEEIYKRDEPAIPGEIRTFPLVGLAGAMLYIIEPQRALAFIAGLLAIGVWPTRFWARATHSRISQKPATPIGFGGLTAAERPAVLLAALAVLGFSAAALYLV